MNAVEKRREEGKPHHWLAIKVFRAIEYADETYNGGAMDWKKGGDGDNGECVMLALSVLFEEKSKDPTSINDLEDFFEV